VGLAVREARSEAPQGADEPEYLMAEKGEESRVEVVVYGERA